MKNKKITRVSLDVPVDLHRALKLAALNNNMTIKMYILQFLIEELKKAGYINIDE